MEEKLIFIVDDDKVILNLLEYTFRSLEGYEVKTFFSGEECLKNLDLKPDIIVLDHIFSLCGQNNMTGLDMLKELRKTDQKTPVIVLSSQDDNTLVKEFILNGAIKYITKKDYFIDTLIESVIKVISN
jgi:two-component system, OmpR family, response regulator